MSSRVLPRDQYRQVTKVIWPEAARRRTDGHAIPSVEPPSQPQPPPAPVVDQWALDQLTRDAYQRGMREGQAASQEQSAAQLQPVLERLSNMLTSLAGQRARIRQEAESDLVRLSIEIAKRILNRELSVDPLSLQGVVKAALEKMDRCEVSEVRVSPDQVATVELCLERLIATARPAVVADATLHSGSILFQTSKGYVDASIHTQLKEIERGFTDRLGTGQKS